MGRRNDSELFFTCALIDQLGRSLHLKRGDIVTVLGETEVYTSWINELFCDYNSAFCCQSRDYLAECYR